MFVNGILTSLVIHEIARDQKAGLVLSFDGPLGILGVLLLFGEIDDTDVGILPGHEYGHCAANTGAKI